MVLHNFIHDSALRDEEFDKYDKDEEYMPDNEDDERQEEAQLSDDDIPEEANEITINIIRDNIANALVTRG
jgi:hypothetical protein